MNCSRIAAVFFAIACHLLASCGPRAHRPTAKDNEATLNSILDHEVLRLSASADARQGPDPVYGDAFGGDVRLEIKTVIVDRETCPSGKVILWPRHDITITSAGEDRQFETADDQRVTGIAEVPHEIP